MAIRTVEAVILRTRPFRSTSVIAVIFTREFGKIQGLAKGISVRHTRKDSKFFCYLDALTLNKIVYYEKKHSGLHLVTQGDLLDYFQPIRKDLKKLAAASFMLELVDKGTALEDVNKGIFDLLTGTLNSLCENNSNTAELLTMFQVQFLKLSGFFPRSGKLNMPVTDFIRTHIHDEFKTLEFMEKIKNG